jgi:glycosyltransferase involved in cell wall biosynthesis/predicted flap endonuclease-1-like 5' DNA nuclease
VQSALNQRYDGLYEVIVVDDGSDEPVTVAGGERMRMIRHKENKGLAAALNTGVKASKGDRYVLLAADDELHPDHLAHTSEHDADVVSTDMIAAGRTIKARAGSLRLLMDSNCHSYAALVSRSIYDKIGGYKDINPSWEDWEFWLNCAKNGATWHHVPEGLHIYHRNPKGRDAEAQGKDTLLRGILQGYHQDLFGDGAGLVTFVVPCYNHEEYVAEAVQSALDQDYPHTAVIVVDDGSPGDVEAALKDAADDRVTLLHKDNGGLSSARNHGMSHAVTRTGTEYAVMLDADDRVVPDFVSKTMPVIQKRRYVYTDVQLFGDDAWHVVEMPNYDCKRLRRKHLHPCTFLMYSKMWQHLFQSRGYGYDESETMRIGYEDWEFAIAVAEVGWCGIRVSEPLFHYRNHVGGSMRTRAIKRKKELGRYISSKHPKLLDGGMWDMGCPSCGGRAKYTGGGSKVMVGNIGDVDPGDPLIVTYSGMTTSTITKVGAGGRIYKYSGNPKGTYGPEFSIAARDAHMFQGPYRIRKPEDMIAEAEQEPVPVVQTGGPKGVLDLPQDPMMGEMPEEAGLDYEPDDLTEAGLTEKQAQVMAEAGIRYFDDIAEMSEDELAAMLKVSKRRAGTIIRKADKLLDELSDDE